MPESLNQWIDVQDLTGRVVGFVPDLLVALFLVFGAWLLVKLTRRPIRAALRRADFAPALISLLVDNLYRYLILAIGLMMAAGQMGINVAAAIGTLGIAGVAVGFAAQDSLANTIAGFLIFWDKPFRVGDYITVSSREVYGRVKEITMRTTRIRTLDNTYVIIPNREVIDDALINHSMHGETRLRIPVGIAYKEDIGAARRALLDAVAGLEGVLEEPEPTVVVEELGGSSVNLLLRVWISDAAHEKPVFFRALEAAKVSLDDAGIEIPFPHLQLFLDDVEEPVWDRLSALPALSAGSGGDEAASGGSSDGG